MTESWFHRIEGTAQSDWQRVTRHFTHHAPTIASNSTTKPQEPAMALADTSATLQDRSASLRATLENGASALREALDDHMTQIDAAIADVAAVASIADHPLVVAAAGALHVPEPVLEGFIGGLNSLASAFPKPAPAPEQPAEPQPEQPAA